MAFSKGGDIIKFYSAFELGLSISYRYRTKLLRGLTGYVLTALPYPWKIVRTSHMALFQTLQHLFAPTSLANFFSNSKYQKESASQPARF